MATEELRLVEAFLAVAPPFFDRRTAAELLGGALSPGTLKNLDSLGKGPPRKRTLGKVLYERKSFASWLSNRG